MNWAVSQICEPPIHCHAQRTGHTERVWKITLVAWWLLLLQQSISHFHVSSPLLYTPQLLFSHVNVKFVCLPASPFALCLKQVWVLREHAASSPWPVLFQRPSASIFKPACVTAADHAHNTKVQENQGSAPGSGKLDAMFDDYRSDLRQEGQPSQILTEEAALVRALHLSLMEVQHQEQGHVAGVGAAEPAAAASTALQDTVPQDMQSMAPE